MRDAFFVFVLTRSLIFLILICVGQVNVVTFPETNSHHAFVSLDSSLAQNLRRTMLQADVVHYTDLARDGYQRAAFDVSNPLSQKFAFFPLFPLLLWLLGHLTADVLLWSAALNNLFFFVSLILLYKLTLEFGYDDSVASRTLFYLAAFPVSYFFSMPFTESLFVLLTVASFYAAKRERWWLAGVIGLLASATRLTGVFLLPALLVLSWQMYRSLQIKKIVGLLLIPFGLFAYMFYSWWLSGDALAFKHAAEFWNRKPSLFFVSALFQYLGQPQTIAEAWNIHVVNAAAALLCCVCIYFLARRREWALALYTLMSVVVPLSSGVLQSMGRYTMGFFPVFIALGIVAKSERWDQTIRFVFVILLGIMTTLFAARFTNALS